ncbi:MAG TPA: 2-phospho-L-lactate guanylyltransferase [Solirubrobacteraceae bacterium]|nr:2-phospho-L-lactate guanylyltransferase [Solirubrobacteraceae bacterium]
MTTVAILPVKRFERAKQRLHPGLGGEDRSQLAEAMVGDVLHALARTRGIAQVLVVTAEPRAAALANRAGAEVIPDQHEHGQSEAVGLGLVRALADGHTRALLVPGDCPALESRQVEQLLGFAGTQAGPEETEEGSAEPAPRQVAIVPDRHGTGTNALLLEPPDVIVPAFGPGSFARHVERATAAGALWRVARPDSLLLDVDTGEDLDTLRAALLEREDAAPRTRAVLARLTAGARPS